MKYATKISKLTVMLLLCLLSLVSVSAHAQSQCGLDMFVVNDQSGSVDATENTQSRDFVYTLGQQLQPLGNAASESRMALSEFSLQYKRHSWPSAGLDYTTNLNDILDYQYTPRTLSGGTSIYTALRGAAQDIDFSVVPGRSNLKTLLLMTDANCRQIEPGAEILAQGLKDQGYYIVVLAIGPAASCPQLPPIASSGGYLSAADYDSLASNALTLVDSIVNASCLQPPLISKFDLTISVDSYTAQNCNTSPTYTVGYTVTNNNVAFNDTLKVSFYDGDPRFAGSSYLFTRNEGIQNIAPGGTFNATFSDPALASVGSLYAVVNLDGALAVNALPLGNILDETQLIVTPEKNMANNVSGRVRSNGAGCKPFAVLDVDVSNSGVACGGLVNYEVKICNSGTADAIINPSTAFPGTNFALVDSTTSAPPVSGPSDSVQVAGHQKISDTEGNFTGVLDNGDEFGYSVTNIGDLDGDGITDIAVGADKDDDGGTDAGAVWVLLLNADGTVKSEQKISNLEGGFTGTLDGNDIFGTSVTNMGDLDGDGIPDIAVGARLDGDGGTWRGAVWVLFLNADGTVKSHQKISDTQGGFTGVLDDNDGFGSSVTNMGDLDGDGVTDIAVGAYGDDDGGATRGAVWVLFLNADGTVKSHQKISDTQGGFTGVLDNADLFGSSITNMGDLDGDGVNDMVVGTYNDDDGGFNKGAVWVLFLNANGTVKSHQKISDTQGNFTGVLDFGEIFGTSVTNMGDLDGDGVNDMVVGARLDNDGGSAKGAVWVLFLNPDGTVKSHQKISDTESNFTGVLDGSDNFGTSVTQIGDFFGDGVNDIVVGAYGDDDGGINKGAVWVINLVAAGNIISAGDCEYFSYSYDVSGAAAGDYDFSFDLEASATNLLLEDPPVINPDNDFTVGASGLLDGFDGSVNTSDDVTIPTSFSACPVGDLISVSVDIPDTNLCNAAYTTATVTITNSSGASTNATSLVLNIDNATTLYAGEPYSATNALGLPFVDLFDPAYPLVTNAIKGTSGQVTLEVSNLAPGTSTFKVDLYVTSGLTNITAQVIDIPTIWNSTGSSNIATDPAGISVESAPVIVGTCPAGVSPSASGLSLSYSVTGSTSISWASGTNGVFSAPTSASSNYTFSTADITNGYADLSLTAETANSCDAAVQCRVSILYSDDFGDAMTFPGIKTLAADAGAQHGLLNFDVTTNTADIMLGYRVSPEGDGKPDLLAATDIHDDAVAAFQPYIAAGGQTCTGVNGDYTTGPSEYCVTVSVTNNDTVAAQLVGWLDYNSNNSFDNFERSLADLGGNGTGALVADSSGAAADNTYTSGNIAAGFSGDVVLVFTGLSISSTPTKFQAYARFRITSDGSGSGSGFFSASSSPTPGGAVANGEVEDYLISAGILPVTLSSFDSAQTGKRLEIDWGTASELFNSGFQLWGLDKATQQWRVLNKWLVASGGGNSVEPQSYSKRIRIPASIKELESLGISSVDSNGKEHYYGPFEVGKRYGELASLDPIDWHDVRAQADASMTAKGYTRVYGKGYKKVASTDLNKMAADSGSISALEFSVTTNGLYKLKAQDMLLSGSDWSKIPKGEIAILNSAGNPIARHVIAKGSGKGKAKTLGAGGSIVFYANSVDQVQGLYSGDAIYRIVRDASKSRRVQVQGEQGLDGGYSTSYTEQSWTEQQNHYLVNSVLPDPWLSAVVLSYPDRMRGAIYSVPVEADVLRDQPMELIIRAGRSSAQNAVDADSDGVQDPEHILQGIVASPSSATGYVLFDAQTAIGSGAWETRFTIPDDIELPDTGVINAGAAMTAGAGYTFSEVYVDAVGVAYSRPYVPKAGDSHLNFSAEQDEPGYRVQVPLIRGAVAVYASDGANLVKIRPESVDKARTASGERVKWISFAALQGAAQLGSTPIEYWVTNNDGYLSVANLHPTNITAQAELLNAVSGSDYLIISHPAFMGESLSGFANHKRSMGHTVSVVDYLEVVSSFAGGQSGPQGLTDYLNAVEAQTGGSLAHVLLVGGSTYDHRNYLSHDAITFIPTHYGESIASRHTPSDSLYVQDASGAQFAAIGRWPGRTMADIDKLIAATTQWDTQAIEEPSVLLIAEQTKVDEGIDFGLALDGISSILPADYVQTKIYSTDELTASQAKPLIKAALNDAPQLVIYNGHGSTSQLSTRNLYNATDAGDNQASSSALWLPMSCYMTYYESTSVNTLAHQLLFSGQSVAISGAGLLSSQGTNLIMNASILDGLNADNSLGASIDTAKAAANNPGTSVNWSLLGDPSIRIK